ncbi:SHOCT domain-containing protein [Streptomyces sp. RS10V-4]|uniref:SHOCT domain-containing protein n=1 Tax=Streptomyces rhizoryzae TaxID=2932493 RepID=UPI002005980A|nr:SHOCT domain-containing protein [Streptomyces rhizoryzae]MCK7627651.1 SHOCT domain-containing protein [Streptomyces rhizoryzae]
MWYDGGWSWDGWLAMGVIMVLFWGLIIAVIAMLFRFFSSGHRARRTGPPPPGGEPGWGGRRAEDLLAERFARGEIDEEEYRRRLRLLREHR